MSDLGKDPKVVAHIPGFWRGLGLAAALTPVVAVGAQMGLNAINGKVLASDLFNYNVNFQEPEMPSISEAGIALSLILAIVVGLRMARATMTGNQGHISSVKPRTIETRGKDVAV